VVVEQVERPAGRVRISVRTGEEKVVCPRCGRASARVHSRYQRSLADAAVGGQPVVVRLTVRRLFCDSADCPARTFAEQVDGLTARHARRTPVLRGMLEAIGLALAGRAGARPAGPTVLQVPSAWSFRGRESDLVIWYGTGPQTVILALSFLVGGRNGTHGANAPLDHCWECGWPGFLFDCVEPVYWSERVRCRFIAEPDLFQCSNFNSVSSGAKRAGYY
jgi:hypothetical protein